MIYFKKLAHVVVKAGMSKMLRVGLSQRYTIVQIQRQSGQRHREMPKLQFKSKGHLLSGFLLIWGGQYFVLFRPSADSKRPTHIMESMWFPSKPTNVKC